MGERRSVLVDGFRRLSPDLVAFQEAVVTDGYYDQVTDILGSGYHLAHQNDREAYRRDDTEDGQGISIASRWSLGEVREVDLKVTPRTGDFAHTTVLAEVLAPEPVGPLLFVNHALLKAIAEIIPDALEGLIPEERNKIYRMLRLEVTPLEEGYEVSGAFCSSELTSP